SASIRRDVMRTCGCGDCDSFIPITLPFRTTVGNVRPASPPVSWTTLSPIGTGVRRSGDDIGHVRINDQLDLILQQELAFLEPSKLQLVAGRLRGKQPNSCVELPMLGLQQVEQAQRVGVVHPARESSPSGARQEPRLRYRRAALSGGSSAKKPRDTAEISWFIMRW